MVRISEIQGYMQKQMEEDRRRNYVNVQGDTLDEALEQAAVELSRPVKNIDFEILQKGSRGIFGAGRKPYLLLAYPATGESEEQDMDDVFDVDFGFEEEAQQVERDGEAFVKLSSTGILLKVTPPVGKGKRVTEQQAMERIRARTDAKLDTGNVAKAVKLAEGEFRKVGDYDYNPAADAVLSVEIADSEMRAYLTALPPGPGGADPDYDSLVTFLQDNGVVSGWKENVLSRFADDPVYREPVLVAEGTSPKDGGDARIAYNFETDGSRVRLKEQDGRVDFKELDIIQNVVEGQVLAKKIPAERGTPGRTVTGKLLPAKDGKDTPLLVGKNVRLSEDKRTAIAELNGQVFLHNGKIQVEEVYVVNGDVNLKTGNITFLGGVVVKGNVDDGFNVKASGNIEVAGSVGKSLLDAEGDIIVRQGVAGKETGIIRCGGNLWSKFVENVTVEAGGMVIVTDGIMNSEIYANRKVICRGKRASIVGGRVRAAEEIDAKALGTPGGRETILEVGYDPKSKQKLVELKEKRDEYNGELDGIKRDLKTLINQSKQKKEIPKEKVQQFKKLQARRKELAEEIERLDTEIGELESYLEGLKVSGKVGASGTVYPGVKLYVKDAYLDVHNEFNAVTFSAVAQQIKVGKYEESSENIEMIRKD
ncbi:MAG: FapA family protein [Spirochaetaceae bacterium]